MATNRLQLQWRGNETIAEIQAGVERGETVEVVLPADVHHAVFKHLHPNASKGAPEDLHERGDSRIVERLAEVRGLEALARLVEPVARSAATVHVHSPGPRLVISRQDSPF